MGQWDEDNDEQMLSPKDPNFLRKYFGGLEPGLLESIMQEGTILLRISFRYRSL